MELDRHSEYTPEKPLATWWRQSSPGCAYWRCFVPAKQFPGNVIKFKGAGPNVDIYETNDGKIVFPRVHGNTVIAQFPGNATGGTLIATMQDEGIRVLVDVDDSYLRYPDVHGGEWQIELDRNGATDRFSFEAHARICSWADGIIVSTDTLADEYSHVNDNIWVCPNSVDPDDWPEPEKPDDGILRIGWAASHSHIIDAPLVRRALDWASRQPKVEVYVYGIGERYKFTGAVKKVGWTDDLAEYRRSLARCDIHLCPLIETDWSRHKSDIKAMEAAMAGAWPIVSTATPYREWQDLTIACTSAKQWEQAIKYAVKHRDSIPELAADAKRYVLEKRQIKNSIHLWRDAVCAPASLS